MTEKRKLELAIDGVISNIVSECKLIANSKIQFHSWIETLHDLIEEYDELTDKYHTIKSNGNNSIDIPEIDAEEFAEKVIQSCYQKFQ